MTSDSAVLRVHTEDKELASRLDAELIAFNTAATGCGDQTGLSVRVTDPDGSLVAGLAGWTWGGCAGINAVWVRADSRRQGWGSRILRAAEDEARRRGCDRIMVSSLTFQAPAFYQRHGYVEVGRQDAIPGGNAQHHFVKSLIDPVADPA